MLTAKWIPTMNGENEVYYKTCSNCGYVIISAWWESDVCPQCWAIMQGGALYANAMKRGESDVIL